MLADRFEARAGASTLAERAREDRTWTFGHAVVDEAQELSPMQWRLVARRVPVRSMTVVGDVAQTGSAAGTTAWADVLDTVAEGRWRLEELTVNYRTPAEVMELATALLEAHGIAVKPARSARSATWPPSAVRLAGREPAIEFFTVYLLGSVTYCSSHCDNISKTASYDYAVIQGDTTSRSNTQDLAPMIILPTGIKIAQCL